MRRNGKVANLVIELCEASEPNIEILAKLSMHYPVTASRRLGFLMENFAEIYGLTTFKMACKKRNASTSLLDPLAEPSGYIDEGWNIRVNREVAPDV